MTLKFEPIELERNKDYTRLLAQCPQVASDYSFLNLWAWARDYGLQWAWEDDLVWIRQTDPRVVYWAPIGAWEKIGWRARFNPNGREFTRFCRVPQQLTDCWHTELGELAKVSEDRGNWDYIYACEDLIELKGNRYHKKKNLLNQFRKKYDYAYVPLKSELVELAIGMQTDWCTWRDCESSDILSAENRAIYKILEKWDDLDDTIGGAIMVDDRMVAYTVAEHLTADTVLIHFEKGDTVFKGVYQAMNQMFLEKSAGDFAFVNREQDLNDEGLRKAKLSYLPAYFLKKYQIELPGSFFS
jgi:hypothetical protein